MKRVLILLLILNLVYLAWNLSLQSEVVETQTEIPDIEADPSLQASGARLILVDEVLDDKLTFPEATILQDNVAEPFVADGSVELQPVLEEELAAPLPDQETASLEDEGSAAAEPIEQDSSNITLEQDILLVETTGPGSAASCVSIVGILDEAGLSAVTDLLTEHSLEFSLSATQVLDYDYRVYMPPYNSPDLARQRLEELQQAGVDSYIILSGDLAGGISLGFFTRQEQAQILQQELAELGYPSRIEVVEDMEEGVSIDLGPVSRPEIESILAEGMSDSAIEVNLVENLCETIAPEA